MNKKVENIAINQETRNLSWGRNSKLIFPNSRQTIIKNQEVISPNWATEIADLFNSNNIILPYGNSRSYGDSCLNSYGKLIKTNKLNHFLYFDEDNGTITAEAGITLVELIRFLVPKGYFLPVVPGTKYITLGGAIANDIHGKNHHITGTFGNHIIKFELVNENGKFICSPTENPELFAATIGGLGLTGIITWVKIKLKKITSLNLDVENIKFNNLDEFFAINNESVNSYEYTVAWLDCSSKSNYNSSKISQKGIYYRANHSNNDDIKLNKTNHKLLKKSSNIPFEFELITKKTIDIFNWLYFNKQTTKKQVQKVHYDKYFFPLDSVNNWNKLYGKNGFLQYQFVMPFGNEKEIIQDILDIFNKAGLNSFLTVLKTFGAIKSLGLMSFPKEGVTFAIDFKIDKDLPNLLKTLNQIDKIIEEVGGAIYPAKDSRMSKESFHKFYPNIEEFKKHISKNITSDFWERVR